MFIGFFTSAFDRIWRLTRRDNWIEVHHDRSVSIGPNTLSRAQQLAAIARHHLDEDVQLRLTADELSLVVQADGLGTIVGALRSRRFESPELVPLDDRDSVAMTPELESSLAALLEDEAPPTLYAFPTDRREDLEPSESSLDEISMHFTRRDGKLVTTGMVRSSLDASGDDSGGDRARDIFNDPTCKQADLPSMLAEHVAGDDDAESKEAERSFDGKGGGDERERTRKRALRENLFDFASHPITSPRRHDRLGSSNISFGEVFDFAAHPDHRAPEAESAGEDSTGEEQSEHHHAEVEASQIFSRAEQSLGFEKTAASDFHRRATDLQSVSSLEEEDGESTERGGEDRLSPAVKRKIRSLFRAFREARNQCRIDGELEYREFVRMVRRRRAEVARRHQGRALLMQVRIVDDEPTIDIRPKRGVGARRSG
jgi:hypothetical protein